MTQFLQRVTGRTRMPSMNRYLTRKKRAHSIVRAHENHFKKYQQDYDALSQYIQSFRSSGGLKHQYQQYKLWCLQKLLESANPTSILELGSGSSTLVFAHYAKKNNARLVSIDENEKWAMNTANLVKRFIGDDLDVRVQEKVCLPNRTPPEIKYNSSINETFDFVFIDGPSLNIKSLKVSDAVNSNIFDLPEKPDTIVVDVRQATVNELARHYGEFYDVKRSDLFSDQPVLDDYSYFSVLRKK